MSTEIKDSGNRTNFDTGAVRDISKGKGRMDLLPWHGIIEVSKHCEAGAEKYGEHNVDHGIPEWSLISSAARHLGEYIAGQTEEDHLRAAAWNILWALEQRTTHPELMTLHDWRKDTNVSSEEKHIETCRERLRREHPNLVDPECCGGCSGCPQSEGYADIPPYCDGGQSEEICIKCWDRPVEIGAEDDGPTA